MSDENYPGTLTQSHETIQGYPATQGIIWKIDRFATHDGPGIRTALYFKGCPLKCQWCSNPEGQALEPVLVFRRQECNGCGLCIKACPTRSLTLSKPNRIKIDTKRCQSTGNCVTECPTNALQIWGKRYRVSDILELLEKDRLVHQKSGGGLTCTGGEPLLQGDFLLELLQQCNLFNIHTAVETSAYASEEIFEAMLRYVDCLFIDLKHMNREAHIALTGVSNDVILRNARLAASVLKLRNKSLIFRQVIVPGINDGRNIAEVGDFLISLPYLTGVELLAYHDYGVHKYGLLGRNYSLKHQKSPTTDEIVAYKLILEKCGLTVV